MSGNLTSTLNKYHEYYAKIVTSNLFDFFCSLVVPFFDPLSFLVQLPINLFLIAILPFRFLICMFIDLQVDFRCVIYNMFPIISALCPLINTTPANCSNYASGCCSTACKSIGSYLPKSVYNFLSYVCTSCPSSQLNYIVCILSYVMAYLDVPILLFITPIFNLLGITPPCLFPTYNCNLYNPFAE